MSDGRIVEVDSPEHFFDSPTGDRTERFRLRIL